MTFSASGGNRRAHRCHALHRQDHHHHGNVEVGDHDNHRCTALRLQNHHDHGNVELGGHDDHRCAALLWHDHHGAIVEDGDHGDEVKDPKLENVRMEILQ